MMNSPPFQPLAPGDPLLVGGYRVLARMEASGRGWVYLATTDSGRRLAVWVVRPEALRDPVFRERFRKDMAAARRVGGRRVAPVVDFHADAPQPWVATEYVAGPSLAQVVVESGPLPARAVRILMGGIAEALRDIHAAGVVHGRLMPSSVLLAQDGPRVTGYGVAPAGSVDADILALGGVVFYAATGRQYEGDGLAECPPDVRPLLERCLADVPAERPSPEQIIASLEHGTGAPEPDWLTPEIVDRLLAHATFPGDPDPPPPVPEGEASVVEAPPGEPEHADEPPPAADTSTDAARTDAKHEDIGHAEHPETPHAEEPPASDTEHSNTEHTNTEHATTERPTTERPTTEHATTGHADTPPADTRDDVPARAGGTSAADTPLDTGPSPMPAPMGPPPGDGVAPPSDTPLDAGPPHPPAPMGPPHVPAGPPPAPVGPPPAPAGPGFGPPAAPPDGRPVMLPPEPAPPPAPGPAAPPPGGMRRTDREMLVVLACGAVAGIVALVALLFAFLM